MITSERPNLKNTPKFMRDLFRKRAFRFKPNKSGMFIENSIQKFGLGGPGCQPVTDYLGEIVHDMAHFVEIPEHRMHLSDFGFPIYIRKEYNQLKHIKHIEREMRVIAIELNILKVCGISEENLDTHLVSQVALTNVVWESSANGIGKELWADFSNREDWMIERIQNMRADIDKSAQWFKKEWLRRQAIVDALESSEDLAIAA